MAFTLEDVNAITDEQITPELETALFGKIGAARATTYLTNNGHIVKPKADYDTEFSTAVTTEVGKKEKEFAANETPKFYGAMEKMLKLVGLQKPEGVTKVREWVDKLSAEGKLPFTPEQWTKIEKALKADPTGESLADQYRTQLETYKKEQTDKDATKFKNAASQVVAASFRQAPIVVDPAITDSTKKEEAKKAEIGTIRAVFDSMYDVAEDDKNIMYFFKRSDDKKVAIMDTATGEAMSPLAIMQRDYPRMFAPQTHQQKGAGTGGSGSGTPVAEGSSSNSDLWQKAIAEGLRPHSVAWKKFMEDNKDKK